MSKKVDEFVLLFQMDTAGELAVKINDFPNATRLAKEAMQIPTIEGNDSFIDQILRDDDDVRVAVWMTKVLTKALTNKLQANLKAKLASNFFNTAMEKREIDSQVAKIAAAETALISSKGRLLMQMQRFHYLIYPFPIPQIPTLAPKMELLQIRLQILR